MGQSYGTLLGATYAADVPHPRPGHGARQRHRPGPPFVTIHTGTGQGIRRGAELVLRLVRRKHLCPWQTTSDPTAAVLALIAQIPDPPGAAGGGRTAGPGELQRPPRRALCGVGWPTLGTPWPMTRRETAAADRGHVGPLPRRRFDQRVRRRRGDRLPRPSGLQGHERLRHPGGAVRGGGSGVRPPPGLGGSGLCRLAGAGQPGRRLLRRRWARQPILVVGTTRDPATPYAWAVMWPANSARAIS